jgi:hypothetical protein
MTFAFFCSLPREMQDAVVEHEAVLLAQRKGVRASSQLYQLHGFYVELLLGENNQVIRMESFTEMQRLTPYLQQVDVSPLLSLLRY